MNSDLILFLEENGFIYEEPWEFWKKILHKEMREISIWGGRSYAQENIFIIELYTIFIDHYGNSGKRGIAMMRMYLDEDFEPKIKKIINSIHEIADISLTEDSPIFYEKPSLKILSCNNIIHLDFSDDELKIIDNR